MAKPGPRPKPFSVLKAAGTLRKHRHKVRGTVETLAEIPRPPSSLSAGAKQEWRTIAKRLYELGILTALDLGALQAYCLLRDRALQCEKDVAREGRTVEGSQGIKRHPSLITAEKCWADCRRYEAEFGLTPSARRSLSITETASPTTTDGDEARFFGGAKRARLFGDDRAG